MNVLGKKLGHRVAVEAGKRIISNPDYLIVESEEVLEEVLERFATQPASVSVTDCIAMALAERYRTKLIFGFNEVFRKNGDRLPEAAEEQQAA